MQRCDKPAGLLGEAGRVVSACETGSWARTCYSAADPRRIKRNRPGQGDRGGGNPTGIGRQRSGPHREPTYRDPKTATQFP